MNLHEAFREVERDLWEMGIRVHPETMQDKVVAHDPDYETLELQAYGFQIVPPDGKPIDCNQEDLDVVFHDERETRIAFEYIQKEFEDRLSPVALNPGSSWKVRPHVWSEFLHDGKFAYTYSERMVPQLWRIILELKNKPNTRQGIINFHSNICPDGEVRPSDDMRNMGASGGRIPCSMYYQFLLRENAVNMVYTMRSCDFLTHFPIDVALACSIQGFVAKELGLKVGPFTYFTGSLHAYMKDMRKRGIF
jgi:thymidylate synthase